MKLLLIITGLSGAGKSTALSFFEDSGFICTDNMPANLIGAFVREHKGPFAIVVDSRTPGGNLSGKISRVVSELKNEVKIETVFLESSDETLVKRYAETRRNHPLSRDGNILEGIKKERILLENIKKRADIIFDTNGLNPHDLKQRMLSSVPLTQDRHMRVNITSFGFKHGHPPDADMVFDVRMLANPNFTPRLKPLDGSNTQIKNFVFGDDNARIFIDKAFKMLDFVVGAYGGKDKPYLNVAIGCTGGRHRSVAVADELGRKFGENTGRTSAGVHVSHRDIGKD